MKTGGGIYDYTPEQIEELRAKRAGKLVAVRKALEADWHREGVAPRQRLDRDRAHAADVERPGPQARIPSYSVLIEHDDGLFLIDTGIDLDHMNAVLPFELPEQTEEQTIPAQLALAGFSSSAT